MSLGNVAAAGVCVLCVAATAHAHHSRALYDMTTEVVFDGTVAKLEWRNPHISMTVETKGADGAPMLHEIEVMSVAYRPRPAGEDYNAHWWRRLKA